LWSFPKWRNGAVVWGGMINRGASGRKNSSRNGVAAPESNLSRFLQCGVSISMNRITHSFTRVNIYHVTFSRIAKVGGAA